MFVTPYTHYVPHAVVTAVLSLLTWFSKNLFNSIKKEWTETKDKISTIESTTRVQAENHLNTIQENGKKTNELLEEVVKNQIELNAWLKGRAGV